MHWFCLFLIRVYLRNLRPNFLALDLFTALECVATLAYQPGYPPLDSVS